MKGQIPNNKSCSKFTNTAPYAPMPGNVNQTQVGSTYVGGSMDPAGASTYWSYHHGAGGWPACMTRYGVYQAERAGTYSFVKGTEVAAPQCNGTAGDDTRKIIVAIVNCQAQGVKGNSNATVIPSAAELSMPSLFIVAAENVADGRCVNPDARARGALDVLRAAAAGPGGIRRAGTHAPSGFRWQGRFCAGLLGRARRPNGASARPAACLAEVAAKKR